VWYELVKKCRPNIILGEQVASRLITGYDGTDDMLALWKNRRNLLILKDRLQKYHQESLQDMQKFRCESIEHIQPKQSKLKSKPFSGFSESAGFCEEDAIRFGCGVGYRQAGNRSVPIQRETIRLNANQGVLDTFIGQNCSDIGLHKGQHQGDTFWNECCAGELGSREVVRCSSGSISDSIESINDLIEEVSRDIEAQDGESWLNTLQLDLGRSDYTVGACVTTASGFGAPHIRQRLYWMAHANNSGQQGRRRVQERADECIAGAGIMASGVADTQQHDSGCQTKSTDHGQPQADRPTDWVGGCGSSFDRLGNPERLRGHDGRGVYWGCTEKSSRDEASVRRELRDKAERAGATYGSGQTNGFWRAADWLGCRDDKWRPVEPGTFPLVTGATSRVVRLRAYGNGLCAPAAQGFIESVMDLLSNK
jgi:hypothetical protein